MSDLYFSQIREDSRVERALKERFSPARIVAIGSGGCTAFSLLDDRVEKIMAVDFNPAQCALIELKKAALRQLDRSSFLSFIGEEPAQDRAARYRQLAPELPLYAREFWDGRPKDIERGINQCGATERYYRFLGESLRKVVYPEEIWRELFRCRTLDDQRRFRDRFLLSESWETAIRILLSRTTHLLFFPEFMFARASEDDFGIFFRRQFDRELLSRPVSNNYFLSQILLSRYLPEEAEGYPLYLTLPGYAQARRNLEKLEVVLSPLETFLPEAGRVDAFFLSNVLDWADPGKQEEMARGILRSRGKDAVFLSRNMLQAAPLPEILRGALRIDTELSRGLLGLERSMMYPRLTVGIFS